MAEIDWSALDDGLGLAVVDRGVTAGYTPPPGGGAFVFGCNSIAVAEGAVGYMTQQAGFAPMPKGGSIRAAIRKGESGGADGFSPFLFIGLQGPSVLDYAYLLGLENDDPYRIVLRKGTVVAGIPKADESNSLRRSSDSFSLASADWHHLRLDMIYNDTEDVLLKVYENDLVANPIGSSPDWQLIGGMAAFIDDKLGVNSGSQPFPDGRVGFGMMVKESARRGWFDHIEIARQL